MIEKEETHEVFINDDGSRETIRGKEFTQEMIIDRSSHSNNARSNVHFDNRQSHHSK